MFRAVLKATNSESSQPWVSLSSHLHPLASCFQEDHTSQKEGGRVPLDHLYFLSHSLSLHHWHDNNERVAREMLPTVHHDYGTCFGTTESGHKVKVIRIDNRGEFIGNEFEVVLKKKGKGGRGGGGGSGGGGGGCCGGGGGSGGGCSGGSGGGSGGFGGGGGGSGGSGGSGSGGGGGGRTGGSGGGDRQQKQRRSETLSPQQLREWFAQRGASGGSVRCPYVIRTGDRAGQTCGKLHTQHRFFFRLDDAWRAEFGDEAERPRWAELLRTGVAIFDIDFYAILAAMYALSASAEALRAPRALLPCSPARPAALQPCAPCCPAALCALLPCAPRAPCSPAAPHVPYCPAALCAPCALRPCAPRTPYFPAVLRAPRALQPCAPRTPCWLVHPVRPAALCTRICSPMHSPYPAPPLPPPPCSPAARAAVGVGGWGGEGRVWVVGDRAAATPATPPPLSPLCCCNCCVEVAALGASESVLPGTAPAEALHNFTLDSGASRCFFRESTTLTPLFAPVPVRLGDPSAVPFLDRSSTVLPCPAVPSSSVSGLHLPSFSTNLVSTPALQDAMVTITAPGGQCVSICMCTRTGRHLITFTRRPGSSLYTLATEPPQVAASDQVSTSGQVALPCLCHLLSHQNLLWHHRLGHPSLPRLHGMHSCLLVSGLRRSLPPLPPYLLCVEGRQRAAPHSSLFPPMTAPLQTLHMDVWGPARVSGQGRERYFLLVVDDFTRYTTVFPLRSKGQRWQFAVRYNAHQLNLWPHVSLPETSPTLRWTGKVGNALFRFYHSTSRRVLPSQDVTFDKSVPFYHLFPYRSAPPPPSPLFLAPGPPPVDPLPSKGPAPSGVSQVDPLLGTAPVKVAVGSGAAPGAASGGAEPGGAEPRGAGVEPGGTASEGAECGGAEQRGTASSGGHAGTPPRLPPRPEPLSPHQLPEWFAQPTRLRSGAAGARVSAAGDTRAGGAGVIAGAGGTGATAAAEPGGARTVGTGDAKTGGVGGAGSGEPTELGAAGPGGAGAVGTSAGGTDARGAEAGGAGAVDPGAGGAGGTVRPGPYFFPLLQQVLGVPSFLDQSQPPLQPASPQPAPSPYIEQTGGLTERREPVSRPASPVHTGRRVPRPHPPPVPGTHAMALRPSSVPLRVPLPPPPQSSCLALPDPESHRVRAASPTVSCLLATVVTDPSFESTAASALIAELVDLAAACRQDYTTALIAESESASPPSVGEAITGPYSSQWQAAMDAKMASCKSTGTYVDRVPPSPVNIVDGMWIFWVKRPPGYVSRGFIPPSDESVEPSGPYPELVGCLMYLMTCIRPDLAYPLSLVARHVAPGRHRKVHWDAAKRLLRYLCSTSGMGLVLGGQGPVVLTGHTDASWVDDSATQRLSQGYTFSLGSSSVSSQPTCLSLVLSSSCEAEIYAGAMAAQELCWPTYLLTELGEQPRSPTVLYVDNKAMIALC
ncbi:unnamed protein product [Closterium sp. NIES-54]